MSYQEKIHLERKQLCHLWTKSRGVWESSVNIEESLIGS